MENKYTRVIYDRSPICLQNVFTTLFGFKKRFQRYGKWYRHYRSHFTDCGDWSVSKLREYQDEKVREVIANAYADVTFYRRRMEELGLKPTDIRGVADLPKLPRLEKVDVQQASLTLVSRGFSIKRLRGATTSGSTGFPMVNYWTQRAEQREYGFHWARRRPLVCQGESYGSFTGLQLLPADSLSPPFWRYNCAANQTCYSVFHMTPQTIPYYLAHMEKCRHVWLEGYPTPIAILAKYILDRRVEWPCPPKAVFVTSEQLQPDHRQWIETGFKTRVFDQYGQNEKAGSVTEYECGHLHYDMDYSVIEFLPLREEPEGVVAEMVCTAFDNEAFPLIRYCIGDLALLPKGPIVCSKHPSPVILAIYGRTAQILIGKDGRQISNISVIAKRCRNVDGVQCVQYEPGKVEIRVIKAARYAPEDEDLLLHQFRQKMGQMDFTVVYVNELEKTASGKILSIISRVGICG